MRKRNILFPLLFTMIIFIGQYLTFRVRFNRELSNLQTSGTLTVSIASSEITDWISQAFQVLNYLTLESAVISFVDEPDLQNRENVANIFTQISSSTASYDQIRLLNMVGMETVRVDYEGGIPVIIPQEALQDKSDRYYFIDCAKLSVGEYFISPLDLNIENNEIEVPYKPVVRVCTPIANSFGEKQGVLVLNYLASIPLNKIAEIDENLMILNSEGFWLQSPKPEDEWGFMFGYEENFSTRFPDEWHSILSESSGQFKTDNGLWVFSTINPITDVISNNPHLFSAEYTDEALRYEEEQYFWKVVSYVSPKVMNSLRKEIVIPILLSSLVLYPLAYFGTWNLNRRMEVEKQADKRIRFMATHDMMTGLFNRAFFETELERLAFSRLYPVSIFVLDANNLKEVNDTHGHLEGDKVIKSIAEVLKDSFRTEDIIARVGGDEFAVLLPQTDQHGSQVVLKRLQTSINAFNQNNKSIKVDVSIGVATSAETEDLDNVLKRADEAMYAMKISQKKKAKKQ